MTASATYQSIFPPSTKRPHSQVYWAGKFRFFLNILQNNIPFPIWLSIGAVIQAGLLFLPLSSIIRYWKIYATLPPLLFLIGRLISSLLVQFNFIDNPYLKGAIIGRYTTLVPDEAGNFPSVDESPTKNKIAVLINSVRINHPLGFFGAPHSSGFVEYSDRMFKELDELPQEQTGFLGQSSLTQTLPSGAIENIILSYWRSIDDVHAYAVSPAHMAITRWWNTVSKTGEADHIGIMHEVFEAPASMWESIYINFQPTMLGATSFLKKSDEKGRVAGTVGEEWLSPIVDANRGKLRSARGRLGQDAGKDGKFWQLQEEKTGKMEEVY